MIRKIGLLFTISAILFSTDNLPAQTRQLESLRPYQEKSIQDTRVYYSVFVQSFYDTNNDGIGDIKGLTQKLEYLSELGVEGIWLLPVHPSPTYHKYDVIDYYKIHPDYGTLDDYKELVKKANELDIKILLDLVVNHTSDRHPWFKKAKSGNKDFRNYYVWTSDEETIQEDKYKWHEIRDEKGNKKKGDRYYGFFWWEMPDLNFDEQKVREGIIEVGKFWLEEVGVDGFRLDAAEHIYPPNEINKTLLWWQDFRNAMTEIKPDVFIVGEVWGGSQKNKLYLENSFNSTFNFELSDTIIKSVNTGNDLGIVETVKKISEQYSEFNTDFQDATLLTNHDMERVMSVFNRDVNKAKTAAALLLTLPGNPFIYYGEEIGMLGEKPDEYIREPFLWNIEGEDSGQTSWEIPYASSSKTVKPLRFQLDDRASIYNFYKSLLNIRKNNSALKRGSFIKIDSSSSRVVTFYRHSENQEAIVIINLSDELERIPTLMGLDGFEMKYSNFNVFKINDKEISIQPYGIFILTRDFEDVR